ncbi:MAG: hypothetical protein U0974_09260 [Gemmatimonadales bacterium]|nr:hypothetical protein [Gemmatimonadales bacterium]
MRSNRWLWLFGLLTNSAFNGLAAGGGGIRAAGAGWRLDDGWLGLVGVGMRSRTDLLGSVLDAGLPD